MPSINIVLNADAVQEYGIKHGITEQENLQFSDALLLHGAMASGQPAVLFVVDNHGAKLLVRTSLQILETACRAMRAASGIEQEP